VERLKPRTRAPVFSSDENILLKANRAEASASTLTFKSMPSAFLCRRLSIRISRKALPELSLCQEKVLMKTW